MRNAGRSNNLKQGKVKGQGAYVHLFLPTTGVRSRARGQSGCPPHHLPLHVILYNICNSTSNIDPRHCRVLVDDSDQSTFTLEEFQRTCARPLAGVELIIDSCLDRGLAKQLNI